MRDIRAVCDIADPGSTLKQVKGPNPDLTEI